jgi:uncharacterized protein
MDCSRPFLERCAELPWLGLGISTEFGARHEGLDLAALRRDHGDLVQFLEIGGDLERGLDEDAWEWVRAEAARTYHFLDLNLEEADDLEAVWLEEMRRLLAELRPAWLCGDAGLWHVGPRDRGHGTLMPPVLHEESAKEMARGIRRVREELGYEVLPENPPAHVYLGDLHLLDYFARVLDEADTGMLLDVSHLTIYQLLQGRDIREGFDGFPFERVIEVHIAGGSAFESGGRRFYDDDHGVEILEESWEIYREVLDRSPNLRAVAFECEHNRAEDVLPVFRRLRAGLSPRRGQS